MLIEHGQALLAVPRLFGKHSPLFQALADGSTKIVFVINEKKIYFFHSLHVIRVPNS